MSEARILNRDNSWNADGLLDSRSDEDSEVTVCPQTGENLFFVRKDGTKVPLTSYGTCHNCKEIVHFTALKSYDDKQKPSYPVNYIGYWCKKCYALPEAEWKETKDIFPSSANDYEEE